MPDWRRTAIWRFARPLEGWKKYDGSSMAAENSEPNRATKNAPAGICRGVCWYRSNLTIGRLVIADLLSVVTRRQSLHDRRRRVLRNLLRVAVHVHSQHHVRMGRDQRVVLLRLADAL